MLPLRIIPRQNNKEGRVGLLAAAPLSVCTRYSSPRPVKTGVASLPLPLGCRTRSYRTRTNSEAGGGEAKLPTTSCPTVLGCRRERGCWLASLLRLSNKLLLLAT